EYFWRSGFFYALPIVLRGSSATKCTHFGTLKRAMSSGTASAMVPSFALRGDARKTSDSRLLTRSCGSRKQRETRTNLGGDKLDREQKAYPRRARDLEEEPRQSGVG